MNEINSAYDQIKSGNTASPYGQGGTQYQQYGWGGYNWGSYNYGNQYQNKERSEYTAAIVGFEADNDVAVLKIEAAGLSTDTKPVGTIVTGSLFLEANTGKVFVYDETGAGTWTESGGAGA